MCKAWKVSFQGHISVTMINIYQNCPYMQSLAVQTKINNESGEQCYSPWVQQKMSVVCWCSLFTALCKKCHPSPASHWIRSVRPCFETKHRLLKTKLHTMTPKDDKLHRWWINATIRSLIHQSLAEQKVGSYCDKSELLGSPQTLGIEKCQLCKAAESADYRSHWLKMGILAGL